MKLPIALSILGVLLIAVDVIGVGTVAATVNIDTIPPNVGTVCPWGISSAPTLLKAGESYRVYATVDVADRDGLTARVRVDGTWRTLPMVDVGTWYDRYEISLTAPTTETTISYYWEIKDKAGNTYTKTTYAKVSVAGEGEFYINDTKVTQESTLTFTTKTLKLEFVATKGASSITKVRIVVVGYLDKTKESTTGISSYQETWTAPADGTYTINCYFTSLGTNYQLASVLAGLNTEPEYPTEPWQPSVLAYLGSVLIVAGVGLGAHRRWGLL